MRYAEHRLRKYQRKKDAARGQKTKWDRLSILYWRYWHKVHAGHTNLWSDGGDA